jgi:hypothetical protein
MILKGTNSELRVVVSHGVAALADAIRARRHVGDPAL